MTFTHIDKATAVISGGTIQKAAFGDLVCDNFDDHETRITQNATNIAGAIPYSYFTPMVSAGGMHDNWTGGEVLSTLPRIMATGNTGATVRTITCAWAVGFDANVRSQTFTGLKLFFTTAPGVSVTVSLASYSGSTLAAMTRIGAGGSVNVANNTGLQNLTLPNSITIAGASPVFVAIQGVLSAAGGALAASATLTSPLNLPCLGGKWGEYTTSATAPGTTLDASATTASINAGSLVWAGLF